MGLMLCNTVRIQYVEKRVHHRKTVRKMLSFLWINCSEKTKSNEDIMILTKRKIKQIKRPTWLVRIKTKTVTQILNEEGINGLENWLDKGNKMEEWEKSETRYNINQGFEVLIVKGFEYFVPSQSQYPNV